ncbi:MAG: hypothetical protein WCI72_00245 [archaeon]
MSKQKTLYQRLVEFSQLAFEDNRKKLGVYMVGVESEKLVYGFDEKDPLLALRRLTEKGYSGQALPFDVFPSHKNYCPSVWKTSN